MLKDRLRAIKEMPVEELQSYSQMERMVLVKEMLENIGSTDWELRDELIYATFFRLVMERILSDAKLISIIDICLSEDFLFYKINEPSTDAVFTRSFSSLVITLVLFQDKTRRFLAEQALDHAFARSMDYMNREQDTRGYVEGKGWAHSIAHGADMLAEAAGHPAFDLGRAVQCLSAVSACLFKGGYYMNEEDDRLIFVLDVLLEKGLPDSQVDQWVADIFDELKQVHVNEGFSLDFFRVKTNVLNFVKTLYFRLTFLERSPAAREQITENLNYWHRLLYTKGI